MAGVDIDAALAHRMQRLGLREEDLEESFIRGTGPGGQKINKTSSTVTLRHRPSGVEVRCQKERYQSANRYWARVELCEELEKRKKQRHQERQDAREKKRRQSRPRPKSLQRKILKEKRHRGEIKKGRGRVRED